MIVKPNQSISVYFGTSDAASGAATDADSTPSGTLYENGADSGETVTVSNVSTGLYKASFSIPNDASAEDVFDLVIVATVDSVTGKDSVWRAVCDTVYVSDLNDLSAAEVNAEADTALADYDAPTKAELDSGLAGLNDLSAAEVNAEVDTALGDYDGPTKAELDSGLAGLNDLSAAEVNSEVDTALSDYDGPTKAELDSGLAGLNDPTSGDIADAVWEETLADHSGTAGSTAEALDNAGGVSAADIADAVWDEDVTEHTDSDSTGQALNSAGGGTTNFPAGAIEFTYTVTDDDGDPVSGVDVWVSTDSDGDNVVWRGVTDAFGVARNVLDDKPMLDAGTYYFWKQSPGYTDDDNPDIEEVS